MSDEKSRVNVFLSGMVLTILMGLVVAIIWFQQARFLLPTTKPIAHQEVLLGAVPALHREGLELKESLNLLHFYNPDCPCSRFNLDHFRSLLDDYDEQVGFYIILQAPTDEFEEEVAEGKLKVFIDKDGKVADLCGVYSTPQAVVLDTKGSIVYRGNYNRARFCNSRDSWFTQMVLDSELSQKSELMLSEEALIPYGCNLPSDQKTDDGTYAGLVNTIQQLIN